MLYAESILNETEIAETIERIYSLEEYWTTIEKGAFYTLGDPVYQNVERMEKLKLKIPASNRLLLNHFGNLYEKITLALSKVLNEGVFYHNNLSFPGFHIFKFNRQEEFSGGSTHFDLPHFEIDKLVSGVVDRASLYSFTLSLKNPAAGAGVTLYDHYYKDHVPGEAHTEIDKTELTSSLIEYEAGKLYVFNGYQLHRIAPVTELADGDERITLQGHCTRLDNRAILFW